MSQGVGEDHKEVIQVGDNTFEIAFYECGNLIGRGGCSYCYDVRKYYGLTNQFLKEEAILKVLITRNNQNTSVQALFDNEVRTLRILNGEHSTRFARCLTHWKTSSSKKYYILLEKCMYGSLGEFCKYLESKGETFTQLEILFFIREILKAVRIMHNLKMMHRDLKLQNILIGQNFGVKLIDFGLTKIGEDGKDPIDNSNEGTPLYMSPQMLKKEREVYSYEVDLWAIGIILYYMIYLSFPFKGESKKGLEHDILYTQIKFKKKLQFKQLIEIAKDLLNRDAKKRPNVQSLLKHPVFDKLEKQRDIHIRIQEKYKEYFNSKLSTKFKWKKQINQNKKQLEWPEYTNGLTEQNISQRRKVSEYIQKKALKLQKVKIIRIQHIKKYGYFFLLSNLSLFACFNNCKTLKFTSSLLQSASNNEQVVLCYVYQTYFMSQMKKMRQYDAEVLFNEPQCSIKKVSQINDNLFVRLTNNALQVFIGSQTKQDGSIHFRLQLNYNTHHGKQKQINIIQSQKQYIYDDCNTALESTHKQYVEYVKKVLEVMLDNSCISFQQLHLQRTS